MVYKYYIKATKDYGLQRVIKTRFYQLIPVKKLHSALSNMLDKLEQGGVLLPAKLLISVLFVPLVMVDYVSTTSHTESSLS